MSKVLFLSTSLRANSNSETLAKECAQGATEAGHSVEFLSLKGKKIDFCIGCLACQKTGKCVLRDDVAEIADLVFHADTLVFATPVYYYGMCGQMKTLLDRLNPLYGSAYRFRRVYLIATAAEEGPEVFEDTRSGLKGFVDCFEEAELCESLECGGLTDGGEAAARAETKRLARNFGKQLK